MIRPAVVDDSAVMADLASLHRSEYARVQPQFWREAAEAVDIQRRWFAQLIADQTTLTLVAQDTGGDVVGLLIASLVDPPPVYDPGGRSGLVDDFVISTSEQWETVGRPLLEAARDWLREQGAAQIVVVAGFHDEAKRAFLDSEGLSIASTWHVAAVGADGAEST